MDQETSLPWILESANDGEYVDDPINWIEDESGKPCVPVVPCSTYPGIWVWPISKHPEYTVMRGSRKYITRMTGGRLRWGSLMIDRYLRRFHKGASVGYEELMDLIMPIAVKIREKIWMHDNTYRAMLDRKIKYGRDEIPAVINGKHTWLDKEQAEIARIINKKIKKVADL